MPPYYYHLKFELYPTEDPSAIAEEDPTDIWVPKPTSSIFDNLPAHPRKNVVAAGLLTRQQQKSAVGTVEYAVHNDRNIAGVIDCGLSLDTKQKQDAEGSNIVRFSERQWRERTKSFPPPGFTAGLGPTTAARDWRFGKLSIESLEMDDYMNPTPAVSLGPSLGGPGQATKARYTALETKNTEVGWGIVHLYREAYDGPSTDPEPAEPTDGEGEAVADEDLDDEGTVLCIPSVPIYLSPTDFLGFINEKWRGDISHYRMIMTSRMSRYMVLVKFRDHKRAKEWRKEFDGTVFNTLDPEVCHVGFIKSITIEERRKLPSHVPESSSSAISSSLRPFPPPTPSLIELPTCTICLERMDDTTGLMTILCQHVFHCTCLQTWKGQGCPVCRATNPRPAGDPSNPYTQPFSDGSPSNLCSVCDQPDDLWMCLICGVVGCGRYKNGHAKEHWKETAHSFSLEIETQHVWDYAGDMWVHRLIRDKGDGKVVELPGRASGQGAGGGPQSGEDVVPRAKLENIGLEYSHLLTSQLESQRLYFEEMVNKAADKASAASAASETAMRQANTAMAELKVLREEHQALVRDTIPGLEKELARERRRADKSTELARGLGKSLQAEKTVSGGLMERIEHLDQMQLLSQTAVKKLEEQKAEMEEANRDLTMFISGQQKLKELEEEGQLGEGEAQEGTASVPEAKGKGKGKGKGKKR